MWLDRVFGLTSTNLKICSRSEWIITRRPTEKLKSKCLHKFPPSLTIKIIRNINNLNVGFYVFFGVDCHKTQIEWYIKFRGIFTIMVFNRVCWMWKVDPRLVFQTATSLEIIYDKNVLIIEEEYRETLVGLADIEQGEMCSVDLCPWGWWRWRRLYCACVDVTELQLKPLRGECTMSVWQCGSHNNEHSTGARRGRRRAQSKREKLVPPLIFLSVCSDLNIFNDNKSQN